MKEQEYISGLEEAHKDLRSIMNTYIDSDGEIDWESFLIVLKKHPDIEDAYLENSNDKMKWVKEFDEQSYTRLVIKKKRAWTNMFLVDDNVRKMLNDFDMRLYGLLGIISQDYSSNLTPSFVAEAPSSEWTDSYIILYFMWYNFYGS